MRLDRAGDDRTQLAHVLRQRTGRVGHGDQAEQFAGQIAVAVFEDQIVGAGQALDGFAADDHGIGRFDLSGIPHGH
ncbi:hypothetical protein IM25_24710 (plasmid) [Rhodococcus sp. p52]|nr:hypothetical protein IM25_24710 [Rhodococcus sp. p52]